MKQYQRLHAALRGGGFSEHVPSQSAPPATGYMVSDYGTEQKTPAHLSSPQLLKTYATSRGLTHSPPGEYMGGWANKANQTDYLDVSRHYANPTAAKFAMVTQNQESMYDTSKDPNAAGAYIDNADYNPDFKESAPDALEQHPTWLRPYRGAKPKIRTVSRGRP